MIYHIILQKHFLTNCYRKFYTHKHFFFLPCCFINQNFSIIKKKNIKEFKLKQKLSFYFRQSCKRWSCTSS